MVEWKDPKEIQNNLVFFQMKMSVSLQQIGIKIQMVEPNTKSKSTFKADISSWMKPWQSIQLRLEQWVFSLRKKIQIKITFKK